MAALTTPVSVESRFAPYIEELREFFATSGLHFGAGEDILPLAERLQTPGLFSDDLSSLIRSIILRQGGSVPHSQLLDIVAFAIGGSEIEQQPQHFQEPLRQLLAFVSSVVRKPWNLPPTPDAPGPQLVTEPATEPKQLVAPMPASDDSTEFSSALGVALASNAAAAKLQNHPAEPSASEDWHRPAPDREPVPATAPTPTPAKATTPVSRVSRPLRSSARWIVLACLIPIALLLALYLHSRTPGTAVTSATSGTAVIQSSSQPIATSSVPVPPPQPKPSPDGASIAAARPLSQPRTQAPASPRAEHHAYSPSVAPNGHRPQQALQPPNPPTAPIQRDLQTVPDTQPSFAPGISASVSRDEEALDSRPSPAASLDPARRPLFDVSSGVMASHLISAPDPEYPVFARLAHIHGEVILQAVISREGTVAAVRVLSGHRLLRGAAVKAVRRWRYRPYVADGHPVNVATIITINFHPRF